MLKLSSLILEIDPQPAEDNVNVNVNVNPEVVYPLYIKVRNRVGWEDKKLTELREKYGFNKDYYDSIRTWIFSIHQNYLDKFYQDLLKINGGELEEIKAMSNIDVKTVANLYWDILDRYKIGSVQSGKLVDIITKYGWSPANNWGKSFRDYILQDMNQQQLNNLFKDLSNMPKKDLGEIKNLAKKYTKDEVLNLLYKIMNQADYLYTHYKDARVTNAIPNILDKYQTQNESVLFWIDDLNQIQLNDFYKDLVELAKKYDLKISLDEIKSHSKITPELVHKMLNKISNYIEEKETNQGYWKFAIGLNTLMDKYRVKYPSGWRGIDQGNGFITFLPEVHLKKLYKELIEYYNKISNDKIN